MNQSTTQILAARVRGLAKELLAIANQLEAQALHLSVNLPRDLFSDLPEETWETTNTADLTAEKQTDKELYTQQRETPKTRTYTRNGKRMTEALLVNTTERIGKANGYCARNDIERTLVRITGRNREDVREAVNRVAEAMQLTCVKSRSYRYYPRSLRDKIINASCEILERV